MELDPNNDDAQVPLFLAYLQAGRTDEARKFANSSDNVLSTIINSFERTIAKNPKDHEMQGLLGAIYLDYSSTPNFEKAYEHTRIAYDLQPGNLSYQSNLVEADFVTGRYSEAYALASQIVRSNPAEKEVLAIRMFIVAALLLQKEEGKAEEDLKIFVGSYRKMPVDFKPSWSFHGSKNYVSSLASTTEEMKSTILALINLLEVPKTPESVRVFVQSLPENKRKFIGPLLR